MDKATLEIKIALWKNSLSASKLSRRLKYRSRATVNHVVIGRTKTKSIRNYLTRTLSISSNIWKRMDEEIAASKHKKSA